MAAKDATQVYIASSCVCVDLGENYQLALKYIIKSVYVANANFFIFIKIHALFFFSLSLSLPLPIYRPDYLVVCDVEHPAQGVKRMMIELKHNFDLVVTLPNSNIAWISDVFRSLQLCPLLFHYFR